MPSLGSGEATAVASTTLSPSVTNAAPEACLAMRPVSKTRRLPPVSSTATSCFIESSFYFSLGKLGVPEARPLRKGGRPKLALEILHALRHRGCLHAKNLCRAGCSAQVRLSWICLDAIRQIDQDL